jgi:hypothetical protein
VHADIVRRKRSERNGRIGVTSSSPSSVSWTSSLPTEVLTTGSFLCARITSIQGGRFEPVSVVVVQEWVWESSAVVCPMAFEPPVVEGPPVVMVTAWVCVVPERTSVMELFPILAAVYRMVTMFVDIHSFPCLWAPPAAFSLYGSKVSYCAGYLKEVYGEKQKESSHLLVSQPLNPRSRHKIIGPYHPKKISVNLRAFSVYLGVIPAYRSIPQKRPYSSMNVDFQLFSPGIALKNRQNRHFVSPPGNLPHKALLPHFM